MKLVSKEELAVQKKEKRLRKKKRSKGKRQLRRGKAKAQRMIEQDAWAEEQVEPNDSTPPLSKRTGTSKSTPVMVTGGPSKHTPSFLHSALTECWAPSQLYS